jgi:hypothetical protein
MKLCIYCRHMVPGSGPGFERCDAPQNMSGVDPVSGDKKVHWFYCESHRLNNFFWSRMFRQCGRSGRWFVPKEAA